MQPLILTLWLDDVLFETLDSLRRRHFPPRLNRLRAHVTLFHHLPGERELDILSMLAEVASRTPVIALTLPSVRSLGKGVAIDLSAPQLLAVRREIAEAFADELTRQDQQTWRPHVTVQNKVEPEAARRLHQQLTRDWRPLAGLARGVILHRYLGGPWEELERMPFFEPKPER